MQVGTLRRAVTCVIGYCSQTLVRLDRSAVNEHSLWTVEADRGADLRSDLARMIITAGWGLYGLRSAGLSLEDIFLKLTAAEQPAAPPAMSKEEEPGAVAEGEEG